MFVLTYSCPAFEQKSFLFPGYQAMQFFTIEEIHLFEKGELIQWSKKIKKIIMQGIFFFLLIPLTGLP